MKPCLPILCFTLIFLTSCLHGQKNVIGYSLTNESIIEFKPEVFYQRCLTSKLNAIIRISNRFSKYTERDFESRIGLHYDIFQYKKFIFDLGYEIGVETYATNEGSFLDHRRIIHNLPVGARYDFNKDWLIKGEYSLTNGERNFNNLSEISLIRLSCGYKF